MLSSGKVQILGEVPGQRAGTRLETYRCLLALIALLCTLNVAAQIKGVVYHSETQEPVPRVAVRISEIDKPGTELDLVTDKQGSFDLEGLEEGSYLLTVSAVGFGLIKRQIVITGDEPLELEIFLSPGTRLHSELTVTGDAGLGPVELSTTEINLMKSVLMDDPVRALQHLPALASNDDFNSGFAIQGSGFDRVGVLLDGIPVHSLLHTVEGLEDTGSTSLLSADLIEGIDLVPSAGSARWSGGSAGFINLTSRTGNTSRWRSLVSVSGSAFLLASEGPVARGSWVASVRKSYVDWIVRRIDPETNLNFGFYDLFGKLTQQLSQKHHLALSFLHGNTALDDATEGSGMNGIDRGRFGSDLLHLEWDWFGSERVAASTHLYFQRAESWNQNPTGLELWRNEEDVLGVRSVWNLQLAQNWNLTSGITTESWTADNQQNRYSGKGQGKAVASFDVHDNRQSLFLELRAPLARQLTLQAGWSWNRQGGLERSYQSPYVLLEWTPSRGHLFTVQAGQTGQFPFFNQLYGMAGNPGLRPESARTLAARWSYRGDSGIEASISSYYRRRSSVPWRQEGLWRRVGGRVTPPAGRLYENILRDRSYGGDVSLGRRGATGLNGWIAYAWGKSLWSETSGVWFPGNYDQRHGFSVFGYYRWSSDLELSLKWRFATGMPLPAYAEAVDGRYFVATERNRERLPDYARFDFRLAKSFRRDRYRLTLFVEVLNLFDRENVRFSGYDFDSVDPRSGRIRHPTQDQFPILPTAGIMAEF